MTSPALDYFALEAADCLERLRRWRAAGGPGADDARAAARALRGSADLAGELDFAALGGALEAALGTPDGHDPLLATALDEALDAGDAAFRAPRPLAPDVVERMRAAATVLRAAAEALQAPAGNAAVAPAEGASPAEGRPIVPIRSLARDGDTEFVVTRAVAPPTTADRRFRAASVPLAHTLRRLIADARTQTPPGARPDPSLARTLGADLRAAVTDLRELAESYDVAVPARFFARRAPAAESLNLHALAALDAAAAGLLGEVADETPGEASVAVPDDARPADAAAASLPLVEVPVTDPRDVTGARDEADGEAPWPTATGDDAAAPAEDGALAPAGDGFRPPTGDALVALLETGISGLGAIGAMDEAAAGTVSAAAPAPDAGAAPVAAADPDGAVPIASLLYRGRAAVTRAQAVRDELRARPGPPDPALLDELYDLLDLAATD